MDLSSREVLPLNYNQLPLAAALSRHRPRVRVPSSPPFSSSITRKSAKEVMRTSNLLVGCRCGEFLERSPGCITWLIQVICFTGHLLKRRDGASVSNFAECPSSFHADPIELGSCRVVVQLHGWELYLLSFLRSCQVPVSVTGEVNPLERFPRPSGLFPRTPQFRHNPP